MLSPRTTLFQKVMIKLAVKWLLYAAALMFVAKVIGGIEVRSLGSALVAAAVIGLLNMLVRPVLVLLTLPVTVLTLGLFLLVINALVFWMAGSILAGFAVAGFGAALLGALVYSLLGVLIDAVVETAL